MMRKVALSLVTALACQALPFCGSISSAQDAASSSAPGGPQAGLIQKHSPLVSGNGFGFAVVDTRGIATRLYAHPYRFERANPDVTKEGDSTPNLIKRMVWLPADAGEKVEAASADAAGQDKPEISYLNQSQIVSCKFSSHQSLFFMPFGLKRNALITFDRPVDSRHPLQLCPHWQNEIEYDEVVNVRDTGYHLYRFRGVKEHVLLARLDGCSPLSVTGTQKLAGSGWAVLVLEDKKDAPAAFDDFLQWQNGLDGNALVEREIRELDQWRVNPAVVFKSDQERKLWRQSETVLRMGQVQEVDRPGRINHGLILASLPDGVWFTPWVRDMAYALIALTRMGHEAEAREGIVAWFKARPMGLWRKDTRGLDYQISVTRYYGDGSEEADYSCQASENCEFDDWGLALWAISEYWQKTHDRSLLLEKTYRGTIYDTMRDYVVKPLLGNLDTCGDGLIVAEDSSCWEEHQHNKRHYASSTVAAIPGLRGFLTIASAMDDKPAVKLVREKLALLEKGFENAFVKDGFVRGVAEVDTQPKSEVDGATVEAFNLGIVDDTNVIAKTLSKYELLKTASGGYRRNLGPSNYEAHEFLLIDFNLVRMYLKLGKFVEAARMLSTLVSKSDQDNDLIAEMFVSAKDKAETGEIGDPAGSVPMVGFGAGDYIITLSDRQKYAHDK